MQEDGNQYADFAPLPDGAAYLFGLWLGDGSRSKRLLASGKMGYYPNIATSSNEVLCRALVALAPFRKPKLQSHRGCTYFSLGGEFSALMKLRGINLSWTSREKRLPILISLKERKELLEGLWDSDGHISKPEYREARYVTMSEPLRDGIGALLRELGMESKGYRAGNGYFILLGS